MNGRPAMSPMPHGTPRPLNPAGSGRRPPNDTAVSSAGGVIDRLLAVQVRTAPQPASRCLVRGHASLVRVRSDLATHLEAPARQRLRHSSPLSSLTCKAHPMSRLSPSTLTAFAHRNLRAAQARLPAIGLAAVPALATLLAITATRAADLTKGVALQAAYNTIDDMMLGYGKGLLVLIAFVAAGFSLMAANATSGVLKFIGFIVFLSVGFGAALALSGALV